MSKIFWVPITSLFLCLSFSGRAFAEISQSRFHEAIHRSLDFYTPVISRQGGKIRIIENWDAPDLNAGTQRNNQDWEFYFYGGLARLPEMTADGYVLVICHELGHELGGFPFQNNGYSASGGQADYFATHACLRNLWQKEVFANQRFRAQVPAVEKSLCDQAWADVNAQNLCYRILIASAGLATALSKLDHSVGSPRIDTPDPRIVTSMDLSHPLAQCRLDTFVNGALCPVEADAMVIPGDFERRQGLSLLLQEKAADAYRCAKTGRAFDGAPPSCWFKPSPAL